MNQLSTLENHNPDIINWLQAQKFNLEDLEKRGNNGDTALILATREEETQVVQWLIEQGVDVNARNNDGNNALWFACFRNRVDLIEQLIDAGINLNNQNDNGATVLMYTASAGKTEIVQTLLEAGANALIKNLDDFKAIDFAANYDIIRILKNVTV